MRYAEVNLLGVYVAPAAIMMLAAWAILAPLRRLADRAGLFRHVWHPALFVFAVYVILFSALVLLVGAVRS
jgi:protein AaeX